MDKFGKTAKDKVTGYIGMITSKHIYMYGCVQYGVSAPVDAVGKIPDIKYFDEGRLEIIGEGIDPDSVKVKEPGCDHRERP